MIMATCGAFWTVGCAQALPIVTKLLPSILDIATDLCLLTADEQKDKIGDMSPSEWCQIPQNLEPFIAGAQQGKKVGELVSGFDAKGVTDGGLEERQVVCETVK